MLLPGYRFATRVALWLDKPKKKTERLRSRTGTDRTESVGFLSFAILN